ncbi:MAG: flagellar hook-length control protein FliK [Planctomycetota bacterium]
MNSVPALHESDPRIASGRAPADGPNDSSKATFQDAVDARREERARSASKNDDARTADTPEGRENVRERGSDDSKARGSDAAEEPREAPTEPSEPLKPERRERRSGARVSHDAGAGFATELGVSTRRATPRGVEGAAPEIASANSGDAGQSAFDLAGFPVLLPAPSASKSIPVTTVPEPGGSLVDSAVGSAAAPALPSEPRVAPQGPVPPSGTSVPVPDAAPSGASSPSVEALATLHAARAAGSSALTVDPRGATSAQPAASPAEGAAAREPFAPRLSPAELPGFLEGLAVRIDTPQRSAVVDLEPAELGRVSISLSLERDGHVRADVHAQRREGYAALEARLPDLRASLIERGFTDASVSLSLGLPDSRSQRSGAESRRGSSNTSRGRALAAAEIQALLPAPPARHGAVDLWA